MDLEIWPPMSDDVLWILKCKNFDHLHVPKICVNQGVSVELHVGPQPSVPDHFFLIHQEGKNNL